MTSGEILAISFIAPPLVALMADAIAWLLGYQTFSQWIIKEMKKRRLLAILVLLLLILGPGILIWHFEIIPILLEGFK